MARFSEEEVETLMGLVNTEIEDTQGSFGAVWYPEYVPMLQILLDKLQNYQNKHYPEDREDA